MSPSPDKPRWSTAKKAAAKKAKKDKDKGRPDRHKNAGGVPARVKKPRWVDGAPARPESKDKGAPRRREQERTSDGHGDGRRRSYGGSDQRDSSRGDRPERQWREDTGSGRRMPSARDDRASRGGERRDGDRSFPGGPRLSRTPPWERDQERSQERPRRDRDERPRRWEDRSPGRSQVQSQDRWQEQPRRDRDERARRWEDRSQDRPRRDRDARPRRWEDRSQDQSQDRPRRDRDERPRQWEDRPSRDREERPRQWEDRPRGSERVRHPARPAGGVRSERQRPREADDRRYHDSVAQAVAALPEVVEPMTTGTSFADLGLPEAMVNALHARGIRSPFPIQEATIPDSLAGKDLLGRGRTGSGKTLAFGLPTIARLAGERATPNRPRALVLVPTRELALQVNDALEPIARALGVSQKVVAGGMPYPPQLTALDRGVDLVVATPGRLQDLIERGAAILDNVDIIILDEADHMADLGFLPEVTEIMDLVPEGGQRLLFSATLDKGIDELAQRYLVDPVTHSTDDPTAAVTTMEHRVLLIEPSMKKTLTAQISGRPGKTLIFCRTQLGADRVAGQLREAGILAGPIHGGLNQSVRTKVLDAFKDGRLDVLVATDVAARGIHVDDVSLVVQVDPPADHKTYVHRAGRTARAGTAGSVVTLALPHQRRAMEKIIDEVALSIAPERLTAAGAAAEGTQPTGAPVPEEVWQSIIAPRQQQRRGRGPGRPRPDGAARRGRPRERRY